jgi:hypothetical protein
MNMPPTDRSVGIAWTGAPIAAAVNPAAATANAHKRATEDFLTFSPDGNESLL